MQHDKLEDHSDPATQSVLVEGKATQSVLVEEKAPQLVPVEEKAFDTMHETPCILKENATNKSRAPLMEKVSNTLAKSVVGDSKRKGRKDKNSQSQYVTSTNRFEFVNTVEGIRSMVQEFPLSKRDRKPSQKVIEAKAAEIRNLGKKKVGNTS